MKDPCIVCGATDHESIDVFGVTTVACPHMEGRNPLLIDRKRMVELMRQYAEHNREGPGAPEIYDCPCGEDGV